jgi:hypothetical protein
MVTDKEVVSLGKIRADKSGEAAHWSPRDAINEMLQMLDAGLNCTSLIICYDGINGSGCKNATKSVMEAIGLLQVTQLSIYEAGREA